MSEEEIKLYPWRKIVKTLPPSFKTSVINLIEMGHIPELSAYRKKVREALGFFFTATLNTDTLSEFHELIKKTKLDQKVAWNWKKGKSDY
ncbi:MAG: hypothetical protein ACE5R6_19780 [Candidatus Heimdallarchaeota archaeon]